MKLNRLSIFILSIFSVTFFSCEEELDPNADYQETAVIYAMLDQTKSVQYVKVNKAFLNTNSNAITIAKDHKDSTEFYDPIEVKIEKLKLVNSDTSVLETFVLAPVTVTNKEPGAFYYPEQEVYASQENQISFADNDLARVVVTNQTTKKVYSAATRIVNKFCVNGVGYGTNIPNCGDTDIPQIISPHLQLAIDLTLAPNAGIYKASYHIFYMEINGTDTAHYSTEFVAIGNEEITGISKRETLEQNQLFDHLKATINTDNDLPTTRRKFEPGVSVIVEITGGGKELQKYIQVNNSYSAITQTRPFYSNVKNGVGLVSSRYTHMVPGYIGGEKLANGQVVNVIAKLNALYPELKFVE